LIFDAAVALFGFAVSGLHSDGLHDAGVFLRRGSRGRERDEESTQKGTAQIFIAAPKKFSTCTSL
jgi:hypothetical protein